MKRNPKKRMQSKNFEFLRPNWQDLATLGAFAEQYTFAISLCDLMLRAKWAKRILLLCDRRELRKQAHNTFKEYLPGEPRTYVTGATSKDRDKRIYLATYPAMMECYETFDVGFFDLIIADESHRSIYNRYREIFAHFDRHQVGLTATPVEFIARNTYRIFGCEDGDPTAYFSFEDAINSIPPYLVPFEVVTFTTPFLRKGIFPARRSQLKKNGERSRPQTTLKSLANSIRPRRTYSCWT